MVRIVIAGVVGGIIVFCGGAFTHMALNLEGRAIKQFAKEDDFLNVVSKHKPEPGLYRFPGIDGFKDLSGAERKAAEEAWHKRYKEGPAGLVVIVPTGEDAIGAQQLGGEFITNVLAALIAAWIVANTAREASFQTRWIVVLNLGLFTWLCTSTSLGIFYRFPREFIQDGLYCSLIEWGLAGFAIVAIARPEPETPAQTPPVA